MGFKAASAVEELDFDFRPYVEIDGVVPEPSTSKIQQFQKDIKSIFGEAILAQAEAANSGGNVNVEQVREFLAADDTTESDEKYAQLLTAVAKVCSNKPTKAQLEKLPYRHQGVFIGWITGTFLGDSKPATTP